MYEENIDVFLEHHGVKGMRWGVRGIRNNLKKEINTIKKRKPMTKEEKQQTIKVAVGAGVFAAGASILIAAIIKHRGAIKVSDIHINRPSSVMDILNHERETQLSSLKRMHLEGKMDATQASRFIDILNARYDRKISEAV